MTSFWIITFIRLPFSLKIGNQNNSNMVGSKYIKGLKFKWDSQNWREIDLNFNKLHHLGFYYLIIKSR